MDLNFYHKAVLLEEAVIGLNIKPDGVYVDATFGGGGHSSLILHKLGTEGSLYAFDVDPASQQNIPNDRRFVFIPANFKWIERMLKLYKITKIDGLIADLGVSSYQIDSSDRGFSTRLDNKIDMRMNPASPKSAADILASYSESDLCYIFSSYSQISNSRTIARAIVSARKLLPITTTSQLNKIVIQVSSQVKNMNKHLAKVFQALRIEVNEELQALKSLLGQAVNLIKPEGRLVIISYHSEEDRLVKNFINKASFDRREIPKDEYGQAIIRLPFKALVKKPITPSSHEIALNPRSRSAKLRIAIKNTSD